jgi:hypothetical protein
MEFTILEAASPGKLVATASSTRPLPGMREPPCVYGVSTRLICGSLSPSTAPFYFHNAGLTAALPNSGGSSLGWMWWPSTCLSVPKPVTDLSDNLNSRSLVSALATLRGPGIRGSIAVSFSGGAPVGTGDLPKALVLEHHG